MNDWIYFKQTYFYILFIHLAFLPESSAFASVCGFLIHLPPFFKAFIFRSSKARRFIWSVTPAPSGHGQTSAPLSIQVWIFFLKIILWSWYYLGRFRELEFPSEYHCSELKLFFVSADQTPSDQCTQTRKLLISTVSFSPSCCTFPKTGQSGPTF